jgi:type IV pilus assembly protein PilQ
MAPRHIPIHWLALPLLLLLTGTAVPGEAAGGTGNLITDLEVQPHQHATEVILRAKTTPTFTVFKLRNPDRLVVDLIHTGLAAPLRQPRVVDDARLGRIATTQFKQAGNRVSRFIIGLKDGVRFQARTAGTAVHISVRDADAPAAAEGVRTGRPAPEPQPPAAPAAAAAADEPDAADEAPERDHKVVDAFGDAEAARPVTIRRISDGERDTVTLLTDQPIGAYQVLEVYDPFRLVLDVYGASAERKYYSRKLSGRYAERLRVAAHPNRMRLVLDLAEGRRQPYRVERLGRGLRVRFAPAAEAAEQKEVAAAEPAPPAAAADAEPAAGAESAATAEAAEAVEVAAADPAPTAAESSPGRLKDLTFRQDGQQSRVVLDLDGEARPQVVHADARSTVLEIPDCKMPIILERTLDTSEFGGAVQSLSAYRVEDSGSVKVVAVTDGQVPNRLERKGGKLHWVFEAEGGARSATAAAERSAAAPASAGGEYRYAPDQVAGYSVRRADLADDAGGGSKQKRRRYRGRRISLDFKDADIHNILRLISEVAKLNIITSDEVKGKITITMRNVPWDQALDIILKTKKLGKVRHGNIIRIAPLEELAKEQEMAAKAAEAKKTLEPLRVRIISVNYADADDIKDQIKDVLSDRGSVSIDERTNVLIVKDVLENLIKAEGLVRTLDTETPQVLIEARVVEANTTYLRDVGIQWGGHLNFGAASGNPTGLPFPSDITVAGGGDDNRTIYEGTADPGKFAINLPAAVGSGAGGALGFIFGSAGGAAQLNLRLSALENKGAVKIISAPKITTLDNAEAKIGQGVSIPISVTSAAGVNTMFVEAKLELVVTPHITQEGSILLKIKVTKNQPDFSRTGAKGDPTILKKEAETQVLVRDGDTTVIGGIYTRNTSKTFSGVPVLSHIPVLGWFFRKRTVNDERTELLIFITPRIVNRLQATVSQR